MRGARSPNMVGRSPAQARSPPTRDLTTPYPVDQVTTFFRTMKANPDNQTCFECNVSNPQWASVPLGVLLCIDCAGTHRSLGVHLSFVRSCTMDSWNEQQLRPMKFGGNGPAREWFQRYNIMGIKNLTAKYGTSAAQAYKDKLKVVSSGGTWKELSEAEISRKYKAVSSFGFGGFSTSSPGNFFESEEKDSLDSWLDGKGSRNARRGGASGATSPSTRGRGGATPGVKSPTQRPATQAQKAPVAVADDYDDLFDFAPGGTSNTSAPSGAASAATVTKEKDDSEEDIWGFTVTNSPYLPARKEEPADQSVNADDEIKQEGTTVDDSTPETVTKAEAIAQVEEKPAPEAKEGEEEVKKEEEGVADESA